MEEKKEVCLKEKIVYAVSNEVIKKLNPYRLDVDSMTDFLDSAMEEKEKNYLRDEQHLKDVAFFPVLKVATIYLPDGVKKEVQANKEPYTIEGARDVLREVIGCKLEEYEESHKFKGFLINTHETLEANLNKLQGLANENPDNSSIYMAVLNERAKIHHNLVNLKNTDAYLTKFKSSIDNDIKNLESIDNLLDSIRLRQKAELLGLAEYGEFKSAIQEYS